MGNVMRPWLESPPTDMSVDSGASSPRRPVRPEFPDRHFRSNRYSPYLVNISKRSKEEFLRRQGRVDCCNKQESEPDSSTASSQSPRSPDEDTRGMGVVETVGSREEGSCRCIDASGRWGPCGCREGSDPELAGWAEFYRSCGTPTPF